MKRDNERVGMSPAAAPPDCDQAGGGAGAARAGRPTEFHSLELSGVIVNINVIVNIITL